MTQVPLFGIDRQAKADPFYFARVVLASSKGTLMELGISPIVTSSMVLNLLETAKMIHVNKQVQEDRQLIKLAGKFFALLLTFGQAFVYVYSGAYGPISDLGFFKAVMIVFQLTMSGILLVLMDEMMSKGWGLSQGGISLFIAVNVAETMVWKSFSPVTMNTGRGEFFVFLCVVLLSLTLPPHQYLGTEFEGAIVALFHFLMTKVNKFTALKEAFFRVSLPNMTQFFTTTGVFALVVWLQGYIIEIKVVRLFVCFAFKAIG